MNQVTKGSRVAELLTAMPALLDIGFSEEDIAVKVFAGLGPEQFRLFIESTEIDIKASVEVPWYVYTGISMTSVLSFIMATGAYTADELISKYKKADLKKAATTLLANPYRFGVKSSYGWTMAKRLGMNLGKYISSKRKLATPVITTMVSNYSDTAYCSEAGRGNDLVDMLAELDVDSTLVSMAATKLNISELTRLIEHHKITPRASLRLSYHPSTALWLTKRCGDPYWSYELGARLGTRERTAATKADDYDECMRWGRMCIERYGITAVSNSMGNEDEATIMDYFYNAKHEEDVV